MSTPPSAPSPPPGKPRKKRPADVVSFEDLLAAHKTERGPGQLPAEGVVLIGVDFELQRRMAEGLPQRHDTATINSGAPVFSAPNLAAPKIGASTNSEAIAISHAPDSTPGDLAANHGAPIIGAPANTEANSISQAADAPPGNRAEKYGERIFSAPDFSAPFLGAPYIGAPDFAAGLGLRRSGTKTHTIHSISRIEDVLTPAERDLLRWLWEKGQPAPATPSIRLVTGPNGEGARRLATQAGLIYNTFKNLTRALSTKLALDIVKPERNLPTIYAIYPGPVILDRQQQAGFTGTIHKNGGGRELVNHQAQPAPRRPDLTVDELEQIIGAHNFGAPHFAPV